MPDMSWRIRGTGDFDGDGRDGILWRNVDSGAVAIWRLQPDQNRIKFKSRHVIDTPPLNWVIRGTGDTNGDGKTDIIWLDTSTYDVAVWTMGWTGQEYTRAGHIVATASEGWQIKGVGDFDDDSKDDIAFHNSITGEVAVWLLNGWSIKAQGAGVIGTVGVPFAPEITDVYWNHTQTAVTITFDSELGEDYVVECAEADEYSDDLDWSELTTETAIAASTTVTDDLSTNTLTPAFRFYRVKRADGTAGSRKTAAVCQLDLPITWANREFFISTPLVPDENHKSVQAVFSTQLDGRYSDGFLTQLVPADGTQNQMKYAWTTGEWTPLLGTEFDIEPGVGYYLSCGSGLQEDRPLRFTGYVPEASLSVDVSKPSWTAEDRWLAYSMPRATTLETCGLRQSVTGWEQTNRVKLRPLLASVWTTYKWTGTQWEDLANPGVGVDPQLAVGEAMQFMRKGMPPPAGPEDYWVQLKWYAHPPNEW